MKQWCKVFAIGLVSRVLEVSRSGCYDWLAREPSARAREDERLKIEIRAAHQRSRETYGPRRLQPELAANGVRVGRPDHPVAPLHGPVLPAEAQV
jgi:putative transposase